MRVLQVYRDYFTSLPGGIERHVHELAHGLPPSSSTEVLVASSGRRGFVERDGDILIRGAPQFGRLQGLPLSPTLYRFMSRGDYDIIHLHSPYPTGELGYLMQRSRATGILSYHADLHRAVGLSAVYRRFLRSVLSGCARVIVSTARLVERSRVLADIDERFPGKIEVVPFGIDLERFSPGGSEKSAQLRERWGPQAVVLFVGRLRYYKGLDFLLHAVESLDCRLVIAGRGPERRRITALGERVLGERFVLEKPPSDDDLADYYRAADVVCLPSTSSAETFGLVALEAMGCGRPVVTTEVGTATSVVNQHGVTGFVVPPRDPGALSAAIEKLLLDDDLAARMGAAARARAEQTYAREKMLARISEIYQRALRERERGGR